MKKLKLLLLIVALTLPFRGAMAAVGVFCHLGSAGGFEAVVQPHHHDVGDEVSSDSKHSHANQSHQSHANETHQSHAQSDANDDQPVPLSETCAYCSASCGAPPLVPAPASFEAPIPNGAERFPALPVPHVRSIAGGLERPPRTI